MPVLRLRDDETRILDNPKMYDLVPKTLTELKGSRLPQYRQPYNTRVSRWFLEDFKSLSEEMREAVISAISVLVNSKLPVECGHITNKHYMLTCELGRSYRLIYRFNMRERMIDLFFVRQNDDVSDERPGMLFPDIFNVGAGEMEGDDALMEEYCNAKSDKVQQVSA